MGRELSSLEMEKSAHEAGIVRLWAESYDNLRRLGLETSTHTR